MAWHRPACRHAYAEKFHSELTNLPLLPRISASAWASSWEVSSLTRKTPAPQCGTRALVSSPNWIRTSNHSITSFGGARYWSLISLLGSFTVSGVSQQCNQEPEHTRDGLRWIIMGLLLLLLIPAVLGFVISFILNPVHVFTNIVQIIAAAATVLFGFVAY